MNKHPFLIVLTIYFLFSACSKEEPIHKELFGTIKGNVTLYDEFANKLTDHSEVNVILDGGDPAFNVITDDEGNFEIDNIPAKTYDLAITKDGFDGVDYKGFFIVGGDEPLYCNYYLMQKSSTIIENLSAFFSDDYLVLKFKVYHKYSYLEYFDNVNFRVFTNDNEDVSLENYTDTFRSSLSCISGSEVESRIWKNYLDLPSGTVVYLMACGINTTESFYYNPENGEYRVRSAGEPSNIVSIVVP